MSTILQTPDVPQLLSQNKVYRNLYPALWWRPRYVGANRSWRPVARSSAGDRQAHRALAQRQVRVRDAITDDKIAWGSVNQPISPDLFDALYERVLDYLRGKELFVQDLFCGADPKYRLPIQVINEYAWHNLFARQLFVRPSAEELKTHRPQFTIVAAPSFLADPQRDGTNSEVFVIVNFTKKLVLIGGTEICR